MACRHAHCGLPPVRFVDGGRVRPPTADRDVLADMRIFGGTDPVLLEDETSVTVGAGGQGRLSGPQRLFMSTRRASAPTSTRSAATATTASAGRDAAPVGRLTPPVASRCRTLMVVTYLNDHPDAVARMVCRCPITTRSSSSGWPEANLAVSCRRRLLDTARTAREPGPFLTDEVGHYELFDGSRRNGIQTDPQPGGFLPAQTTFDPEFFRISPREAMAMDPAAAGCE